MDELEPATPEQEARVAALESERLRYVNGNPLSARAFAERQHRRQAASRGLDSFLGVEDRVFLSRHAQGDSFPAAATSGGALPLPRAVELGDLQSLQRALADCQAAEDPGKATARLVATCNAFGETLLHIAVLHRQMAVAQTLLRHGASPLARLPRNPNLPEAQSTLESTAPRTTNFRYSRMLDPAEATPIHYACAVGHVDLLKLLLASISTSATSPPSWRTGSLLLWAITCAHARVVEFLVLQSRLESDCYDEDGNNAVAVAALVLATPETPARLEALRQILRLLLRRDDVDVNHKNMYGLTALDVAETPASKRILAQLGARTARTVAVEKLLRWDRQRFRDEVAYLPPAGRRRLVLRGTPGSAEVPEGDTKQV